jgi:hypothetical protein
MSDELRLEIDEYRLDKEWVGQPNQRKVWGEKHADALLEVDEAKSALEVTKAQIDKAIRENPERFGLKKITETVVANTILTDLECQEVMKRLNEARHKARIIEAAVEALEHRKRALEKLVDLQGRDYFSEPRASEETKEKMDRVEKRAARSRGVKRQKSDD